MLENIIVSAEIVLDERLDFTTKYRALRQSVTANGASLGSERERGIPHIE